MNQKKIDNVLNGYFWPPNINTSKCYSTTHDDNDGDPMSGWLELQFSCDGDAWIRTHGNGPLRFRVPGVGGGKFHKI